jgi:hypothetical protein
VLTVRDKAERHSAKSEDQFGFLLAFSAALEAAKRGADVEAELRGLTNPAEMAGYIEGLAAARVQASRRHHKRCVCIACRVRHNDEHLDHIRTAAGGHNTTQGG